MLVGQIHPVCAHPTHIHLVWPTTAKVHQLVALGKHQCRCRVASVLRCTTKEEGCRYIESRARCCDCSSAPQKDSCHLYLDQSISFLRHQQSPESLSRFSPQSTINGVPQHPVFLTFFHVPSQQLGMLFV